MQIAGKKLDLSGESIKGTVVPDEVMCFGDFDVERHL